MPKENLLPPLNHDTIKGLEWIGRKSNLNIIHMDKYDFCLDQELEAWFVQHLDQKKERVGNLTITLVTTSEEFALITNGSIIHKEIKTTFGELCKKYMPATLSEIPHTAVFAFTLNRLVGDKTYEERYVYLFKNNNEKYRTQLKKILEEKREQVEQLKRDRSNIDTQLALLENRGSSASWFT